MGALLGESFDVVEAVRLLESRVVALEQRLEQAGGEAPRKPAKAGATPKPASATMDTSGQTGGNEAAT